MKFSSTNPIGGKNLTFSSTNPFGGKKAAKLGHRSATPSEGTISFNQPFRLKPVQMVSFGIILDPFGIKAAQMLQMVSFGTILDAFGPKAAHVLQMISFGVILDTFGPKAAQMSRLVVVQGRPDAPDDQFRYHFWILSGAIPPRCSKW